MILFFLFCMLLLLPLNIYGQTSLTWAGNGFREGDSLVTRMVNNAQPYTTVFLIKSAIPPQGWCSWHSDPT